MNKDRIKKVMILDECAHDFVHPGFYQMLTKARQIFAAADVEFVCVAPCKSSETEIAEGDHMAITAAVEAAVREEKPELLLIPATALGEEVAPSLGMRLDTGVAAHCVDIKVNADNRLSYMVPAFGGKVIGEIFVPACGEESCAIATSKPGSFEGDKESAGDFKTVYGKYEARENAFKLVSREKIETAAKDISKSDIIVCGGFGIGSAEYWNKLEELANKLGGAAACTRPVIDAEWGPDEYSMIGTSGRSVKPKAYLGIGISGAAHHLCGIQKAGVIINVNRDEKADSFNASDYVAVADAKMIIDALIEKASNSYPLG